MITRASINIDVDRFSRLIAWSSVIVLTLGFLREAYLVKFGTETLLKDLRQIALDTEQCLGSFYSSVLMAIAALLMIVIGQATANRRHRRQWYFLALVFAAMAVDESVSFHEVLIDPLGPVFSFSSYLHFAWIVPGALFVLVLGFAYIPFVFLLPPHIRNRVIASGTIYVTGALGFEAIGGHFHSIGGFDHPYYIMAFLIEESLEVLGLTLFAITLLNDLPRHFGLVDAAGQPSSLENRGSVAAPVTSTAAIANPGDNHPVAATLSAGRTSAI